MTKKPVTIIDVKQMGKLVKVRTHHSNLSGLSSYERKVMSYKEY